MAPSLYLLKEIFDFIPHQMMGAGPSNMNKGDRMAVIEWPEIVRQRLLDPSLSLSPEQSRQVLLHFIKYGAVEGRKAKGKELLIVIGNTGAGKSTLINYQCVANVLLMCW
jgi:tRNA A37 threonylcarbamoyladenosine biosynthesis protein TsaE